MEYNIIINVKRKFPLITFWSLLFPGIGHIIYVSDLSSVWKHSFGWYGCGKYTNIQKCSPSIKSALLSPVFVTFFYKNKFAYYCKHWWYSNSYARSNNIRQRPTRFSTVPPTSTHRKPDGILTNRRTFVTTSSCSSWTLVKDTFHAPPIPVTDLATPCTSINCVPVV